MQASQAIISSDRVKVDFRNLHTIAITLKVSERCNLDCDYCYFFNAGDDSYEEHPSLLSHDTAKILVQRLKEFAIEYDLKRIVIHLHGGEPLLMPRPRFERICEEFRSNLDPMVDLALTVQTNGSLIDLEWIETFERYGIQVGISLDGAQKHNDVHRFDHQGRSSYEATVRGFKLCQEHLKHSPMILAVVDAEFSAKEIYQHFRKDLGAEHFDFLLPDLNHDNFDGNAEAYGDFLIDVFDQMVNDDASVQVRIIDHFIARIYGYDNFLFSSERYSPENLLVTVSSDGGMGPEDTIRSTKFWSGYDYKDVKTSSIGEVLQDPILQDFVYGKNTPATACEDCCWRDVCGSGQPEHRYGSVNGFDNPSVYCEGLDKFYTHVLRHLALKGEPLSKLGAALV
ncbi:MAG: radical SAM protein [Gammaproteobacteria bacterium]|nr:radical SAM protein [Gammaproteobacteria bacterium]